MSAIVTAGAELIWRSLPGGLLSGGAPWRMRGAGRFAQCVGDRQSLAGFC